MILAIGKDENNVSMNFGACNDFKLITIEDDKVISVHDIFNDQETHKLRPAYLKSLGVDVLVIGGLGLTAYELLDQLNIKVLDGGYLSIDEALNNYLNKIELKEWVAQGQHCS